MNLMVKACTVVQVDMDYICIMGCEGLSAIRVCFQ